MESSHVPIRHSEERTDSDRAHAAQVFDADGLAQGWARYGDPEEVTAGRNAQGRFLFNATVELFEEYGFERVRQLGKHAWIVSRVLDAS